SAARTVARLRAEEERKLVAALKRLGVDWSAPDATATAPANLEVAVTTSSPGTVKAGTELAITATVKNVGQGPAFRVLPRLQSDDNVFQDVELPVGKLLPGETKTFTAKVKIPLDALDRVNRLGVEVREARNAPSRVAAAEVRIEALPRPVFAYSWQL